MLAAVRISLDSLRFVLRTRFFWIWNLLVLFFALSLEFITYYDFESGLLVSEMFFTTVVLSGAVNSVVYYMNFIRERGRGRLSLLRTRPVGDGQLIIGKFAGIAAFQLLALLVLLGAHHLELAVLARRIHAASPSLLQIAFVYVEITALSAAFGLIAIWFEEFWALVGMVGVFLVGHLSGVIIHAMPRGGRALATALYSVVPDLDLLGHMSTDTQVPDKLFSWGITYATIYIVLILYASALSLRPSHEPR
jgi:hypothetical protein